MNCIINMTMRMVEFSGRRREGGEMWWSVRHEEMTRLSANSDYHCVLLESLKCEV